MDISMFFEFPGLLITIGVVLLVLSIVLLILAFKTSDDPVTLAAKKQKENSAVEITKEKIKAENEKSDDKALPKVTEEETTQPIENTGIMDAIQNTSDEKEKVTESKDETDDEFDLTKVFETSPDNEVTEKLQFGNDLKTPSKVDKDETNNSDDEIELL